MIKLKYITIALFFSSTILMASTHARDSKWGLLIDTGYVNNESHRNKLTRKRKAELEIKKSVAKDEESCWKEIHKRYALDVKSINKPVFRYCLEDKYLIDIDTAYESIFTETLIPHTIWSDSVDKYNKLYLNNKMSEEGITLDSLNIRVSPGDRALLNNKNTLWLNYFTDKYKGSSTDIKQCTSYMGKAIEFTDLKQRLYKRLLTGSNYISVDIDYIFDQIVTEDKEIYLENKIEAYTHSLDLTVENTTQYLKVYDIEKAIDKVITSFVEKCSVYDIAIRSYESQYFAMKFDGYSSKIDTLKSKNMIIPTKLQENYNKSFNAKRFLSKIKKEIETDKKKLSDNLRNAVLSDVRTKKQQKVFIYWLTVANILLETDIQRAGDLE